MNPIVVVGLRSVHALSSELLALGVGHTVTPLVGYYRMPNDETANFFIRAPVALLHLPFEPRRKTVLGHRSPIAIQQYMTTLDIAHFLLFP